MAFLSKNTPGAANGGLAKTRERRCGHSLAFVAKLGVAAAFLLIFWATSFRAALSCLAQDGEEDSRVSIFLQAPRETRLSLARARKAIQESKYDDAVRELADLLTAQTSEDYFDSAPQGGKPATGVKVAVNELLGALPDSGQAAYELRFGDEAKRLLAEASAAGDDEALERIVREYFHTTAGMEAALLLGRRRLDQNQPLAGALVLRRVVTTSFAARRFEPEASLLLATCWQYAGERENAAQTLLALKASTPRGKPRVRGAEVAWSFASADAATAWLTSLVGEPPANRPSEADDWRLFRGDAHRNARSSGGMPLASLRWQVNTAVDPNDQRLLAETAKQYRDEIIPATPSVQPLIVGDTVLMRSPSELVGVDFKSGKRVWQYPFDGGAIEAAAPSRGRSRTGGERERQDLLEARMWNDAPYGQISSDGKSLYLLDRLDAPTAGNSPRNTIGFRGAQQQNPNSPKEYNQLVSVDLATQGKLNWVVGGETSEEEPRLANAFFLGAPLPLAGKLYAIVEIRGEIRLVALFASSGKLDWSQQLAHVDAATITKDRARRVGGATPSYGDGVLVCPTSAGALVAVDLASRSLLWGQSYRSSQSEQAMGIWQSQPSQLQQQGERFCDATVTIAEGRAIVTPIEGESVLCYDLIGGDLRWQAPRKDGELLFVAAVHDGRVLLVGKHEMRALRLADGKEAWNSPADLVKTFAVPAEAPAPQDFDAVNDKISSSTANGKPMPSGRGFASGDYYYLPTTASEIVRIDMRDGAVVERADTDAPLGNLACYQGHVVSHGAERVAVFFQREPLREEVAALLARDPKNAWALARRGEILLQEGKWRESLADLKLAYEQEPNDDGIHALLIESLLAALSADFEQNEPFAASAETLIRSPQTRAEFRRMLARGYERSGKPAKAFASLVELAVLKRSAAGVESPAAELHEVERKHFLRTDRWVSSRLAAIARNASLERDQASSNASGLDRAAIDTQIAEIAAKTLHSADPAELAWFIDYFGFHPSAVEARLALGAILYEQEEDLSAELAIAPLLSSPASEGNASFAAPALALAAKIRQRTNRPEAAAAAYRQLADRFADVVCWQGKTGRQVVDSLLPAGRVAQLVSGAPIWKAGEIKTDVDADPRLGNFDEFETLAIRGAAEAGLSFGIDADRNLLVCDLFGAEINRVLLPMLPGRISRGASGPVQGALHGALLVLLIDSQLIAVDLARAGDQDAEPIPWHLDLAGGEASSGRFRLGDAYRGRETTNNRWGIRTFQAMDQQQRRPPTLLGVGPLGVCCLMHGELFCLDPLTGERLWSREGLPIDADAFGDGETLIVATPDGREAALFAAADGTYLGAQTIPSRDRRWLVAGRRVLAWEDAQDRLLLKIIDAVSGIEAWRQEFPAGTKVCVAGHDRFAAIAPDGRFLLMPVADSAPAIEARLPAEKAIDGLRVLAFDDSYIVAVETPPVEERPDVTIAPAPPTSRASMLFSGKLYALDRQTGSTIWESPLEVDRHGLLLQQPAHSPLVVFLRHLTPKKANESQRQRTSMMAIDRRTGRVVFADDEARIGTHAFALEANVENQTATLRIPAKTYTFRIGEK